MRAWQRIVLLLGGLLGLYSAARGLELGLGIIRDPAAWQGTGDPDLVFSWLFISVAAAGFVGIVGLFNMLAAVIGISGRVAALLVLVLPGFFGIIAAIASIALLYLLQPDWQDYVAVVAVGLGLPPLLAFWAGRAVRARATTAPSAQAA